MISIDGARCFQTMVSMRDGAGLNTFVFLPESGDPAAKYPVILQRTPYGITSPQGEEMWNPAKGWLPDPDEPLGRSILRGWREIVRHGYAAVYQDCRGRWGSEGEDCVYGDDACDGLDTLEWIASEPWSNQRVGLSGASAGATTALAAASQRHPSVRAFFAQVGGSSIYDDVVYEGQSIEMERLWMWIGNNIPGLSASHRAAVMGRFGLSKEQLDAVVASAQLRHQALARAQNTTPPFINSEAWMTQPLLGYPDFSVLQPHLDEIISHPAPDAFRTQHDFRSTIDIPGFHVTTWFDVFQTSVLAAFTELQARLGNQRLWVGPNGHFFAYKTQFWPRDPYFEWFDHWLKDEPTALVEEPPVFYSPIAWVTDAEQYVADNWRHATQWPPAGVERRRWYLQGDGALGDRPSGGARSFRYDPDHPIPTLGGRNVMIMAGPHDQRPIQALEQYGLIYTGEPLTETLTIAGDVTVGLHVQSDCPDTDFIAKLIDLHPGGEAELLMDGVVRVMYRDDATEPQHLGPDDVVEVTLRLGHISHAFAVGHRLEVDIASSNFPRRIRNTNSGHPLVAADKPSDSRVATNSVHHEEERVSYLELPVIGRSPA